MAKFSQNFMNVLSQGRQPQQQRDVSGMLSQQAAPMSSLQRNLSQAFGMDTRTYGQQASDEMKNIADPSSNEGILQALAIQARYEQDPRMKTAIMAKMAEVKKTQTAEAKLRAEQSSFVSFMEKQYPKETSLIDLAKKGVLTPKNMKDFVTDLEPKAKTKSADTVGNYLDEDGTEWILTTMRTTKGKGEEEPDVELVWSAVDPTDRVKPKGNTTPIGGQYGLTAAQAAGQKGQETLEVEWGKRVARAPDLAVQASETALRTRTMLDLLTKIETGGMVPEVVAAAQGLFGIKPADVGEFQQLAQMEMLRMLNETIKGNPTGREMDEVKKVISSLEKGEEVNARLLRRVLNEAERVEARNRYLIDRNPSRNEFLGWVEIQMEKAEEQRQAVENGGSRVDFYRKQLADRKAARGVTP